MHKLCATGPQRTPEKKPRSQGGASGAHPRRPLISLDSGVCFFSVQFKQALDLKGLPACAQTLSTKLSTETLDSGKSQSKSKTYTAFPQFNRRKRPRGVCWHPGHEAQTGPWHAVARATCRKVVLDRRQVPVSAMRSMVGMGHCVAPTSGNEPTVDRVRGQACDGE